MIVTTNKTYQQIADEIGVSKSVAFRWMNGVAIPRKPSDLDRLAKAVGVKPSALLLAMYDARGSK